jgi:8-oxo-dGTP diphosphatase
MNSVASTDSGNNRHLVRATVYVILEQEDRLLLLRRHNTGYRDGEYTLPGGHVEAGETFHAACVRGVKEEVCVNVHPENLKLVHVMQRHENGVYVTDYYYFALTWTGPPRIGKPGRADDIRWLSLSAIDDHAIPFIGTAMGHITRSVAYSHHGIAAGTPPKDLVRNGETRAIKSA